MHATHHRPIHGGNLAWAATLANCSPDQILDFSASINPLGPPPSAIAAIHAHLAALRDYPDPEYTALRQALSQFHNLPPEWILPGNGAAELLTWASRELSALERIVLLVPAFRDYVRAIAAFGGAIASVSLPLNSPASLNTRSVVPSVSPLPLLAAPHQSGLLLNNPHNPTGQLFAKADLIPLLSDFELVVIDEAFMDFVPEAQSQSLVDQVMNYPNLVIVRSLTKFYSLPGLRLGYAIAHPDRLQRWQQWRDPWSVNTLAVAAGIAVIQDTAFQRQTLDWLPTARHPLMQGLQAIAGLSPLAGAANFLLVHSQSSVVALQQHVLQQSQILIRDCLSFAELGDRYFRVAVRTEADNRQLLAALEAIANAVQSD